MIGPIYPNCVWECHPVTKSVAHFRQLGQPVAAVTIQIHHFMKHKLLAQHKIMPTQDIYTVRTHLVPNIIKTWQHHQRSSKLSNIIKHHQNSAKSSNIMKTQQHHQTSSKLSNIIKHHQNSAKSSTIIKTQQHHQPSSKLSQIIKHHKNSAKSLCIIETQQNNQ
jgi:hypothetical protein